MHVCRLKEIDLFICPPAVKKKRTYLQNALSSSAFIRIYVYESLRCRIARNRIGKNG